MRYDVWLLYNESARTDANFDRLSPKRLHNIFHWMSPVACQTTLRFVDVVASNNSFMKSVLNLSRQVLIKDGQIDIKCL
jgi:hypothetical protein